MGVENGFQVEGLRRLGRMEMIARNGFGHQAGGIGALQRVRHGNCRQHRARAICQCIGAARQQGMIGKWPYGIVDHHAT
ncbi:hypothetical protein D3C72_2132000 [compost metagenome]